MHFPSPAASHPPSGKASYVSQVCCPLPCLVDYSFLLQAATYNMKASSVHYFKAFITTIYIFLNIINRLTKPLLGNVLNVITCQECVFHRQCSKVQQEQLLLQDWQLSKLISMYLKSQCYPVQWDFQSSEKEFLRMQNFLKEKFKKTDSFLDPLLYFDPQQVFHSISIIKIKNVSSRRHHSYFSVKDKLIKWNS